jgi:hypothetical protein
MWKAIFPGIRISGKPIMIRVKGVTFKPYQTIIGRADESGISNLPQFIFHVRVVPRSAHGCYLKCNRLIAFWSSGTTVATDKGIIPTNNSSSVEIVDLICNKTLGTCKDATPGTLRAKCIDRAGRYFNAWRLSEPSMSVGMTPHTKCVICGVPDLEQAGPIGVESIPDSSSCERDS